MHIRIFEDKEALSVEAASEVAARLRTAVRDNPGGLARLIVATGNSQLGFLERLTGEPGVDWSRVELFHLDEYLGIQTTHPASFCRYIRERVVDRTSIQLVHFLDGMRPADETSRIVGKAVQSAPVDVAVVGIGENGHLAFNEPPADFLTTDPFLVVTLDEVSRSQQVREGWFESLADVPTHAITMSIPQIMKSLSIVCLVPEHRKAVAVARCFGNGITPLAPASILQGHPRALVLLDRESASGLTPATLRSFD